MPSPVQIGRNALTQRQSVSQRRFAARRAFARRMTAQFFLRFHVTLILLWAALIGLLTTKLMLLAGFEQLAPRYVAATVAAYLAFLLGVRIWLAYVRAVLNRERGSFDSVDLGNAFPSHSSHDGVPDFQSGHGGDFGGGGAGGDWSADVPVVDNAAGGALEATGNVMAEVGHGVGEVAGGADEGCLPVLALGLIIAVFLAIVTFGFYSIAMAPALLIDAAFFSLLAGGLARRAQIMDETEWLRVVARATILPVLVFVFLLALAALFVQQEFPHARTLGDLIRIIRARL